MPAYEFGPFRLDTASYRLTRDGEPVEASPRQLDLLAYFATRPTQLVTREELFDALWPDVTVTDNALTQVVSELRHTLEDPSGSPRYVQTVARRGYRFVASLASSERPHTNETDSDRRPGRSHETSNLDALRAATQGRLQLEALDPAEVDAAVESFDRAVSLDPAFAAAYVGRSNARFWKYEQTKNGYRPNAALLAAAVNDARHGIALAPDYAEANATLAYVLTATGRSDEACAAAQTAVALEPQQWSHHFRLGHAAWGETRLGAMRKCLHLYPAFPFAHFQMAMVYVARQDLDTATQVLEEGIALLDVPGTTRSRFPASGLHWLIGSIRLVRDDVDGALSDFERELNQELHREGRALYSAEFAVAALNGRGFALLRSDQTDAAKAAFQQALSINPEQARAFLGLASLGHGQRTEAAASALDRARDAVKQLRRGGRMIEAQLMTAGIAAVETEPAEAISSLQRMLTESPPGPAGWSIPIDPLLASLKAAPAFGQVLHHLARRAE